MSLLSKFKKWYEPKFAITSNSYPFETRELPSSVLAKLVRRSVKFWLEHFTWIITTLVAILLGMSPLYIYLDSKANGKAKEEASSQISNTGQQDSKVTHLQSTALPKKKLPQTKIKNKEISQPEKASRVYARQQTERWRKEIQSFASGGSFNSQEFLKSSTYTEIYPYLSDKTMGQLSNRVVTIITSGRPTIEVQNEVLMALYEDLDRIAAK